MLGILAVQGLCSVAIIRFFLTEARDGFHWFKTLVAPIIGTLAMAGACYLLISNRGVLSGAGDALFIKAVPWVVLVVFAAGHGAGPRPAQPLQGDLRQDRPLQPRGDSGMSTLDAPPVLHPLEPLSAEEVSAAARS